MKKMILAAAVLLCVPAAAVAQTAAARSNDASGRWEATFYTDNGAIPATIVLKKEGEKLAGRLVGSRGKPRSGVPRRDPRWCCR